MTGVISAVSSSVCSGIGQPSVMGASTAESSVMSGYAAIQMDSAQRQRFGVGVRMF